MRLNKSLLILLCLFVASCAQKPVQQQPPPPKVADSYVVLLESPDGSTGKVTFSDQQGQQTEIDKSGVGVKMEGASREPFEVDKAKLDSDFGSAMSAQPTLPATFLLYFEPNRFWITDPAVDERGVLYRDFLKSVVLPVRKQGSP